MATVNYIPCKKQCPASLAGVSNYVKQEKKTLLREQNRLLISGQNCSPQFSHLEFLATRDQFRKDSPVYFYHYTQSFHPEEPVTGELAHTIAQEFAARAWPDNEVLIATHMDAAHIHSHFIVNAVCCDSKMLHHGPDNLTHLREISDEICAAHQPSVLTSPKKHTDGMSSREYRSAVKGQSWKLQNLNFHSLRRTNASLLIAGGADVTTVASLLGHAQPSTTLDIYSHAFDKNRKEASQTLQSGLEI